MKTHHHLIASLLAASLLYSCHTARTVQLTLAVNTASPFENAVQLHLNKKGILINTVALMKKRLSAYGIENPKVELDEGKDQVNIEFSGTQNPDSLASCLIMHGKFGMYETYTNEEMAGRFSRINDTLKSIIHLGNPEKTEDKKNKTGDSSNLQNYVNKDTNAGSDFKSKNPFYSILYPYADRDLELIPGPVVGRLIVKDTAILRSYLQMDAVRSILPANAVLVYARDKESDRKILDVYAIKLPNPGIDVFDNKYISTSKVESSRNNAVYIDMTKPGIMKWAKMTGHNVGRYIAVMFDGNVVSCPRVLGEIPNGGTELNDHYTGQQAKNIACALNSGPLLAPITIVSKSAAK